MKPQKRFKTKQEFNSKGKIGKNGIACDLF
jgi:hypothetical protein